MPDQPTPAEAARALRDVEQRKDQAFEAIQDSLWVRVVFGVAVFVLLAVPDFAGPDAIVWTSWGFALIAVGYAVMVNTRRGSAVLGRQARMRQADLLPRRFPLARRLMLLGLMVIGIIGAFVPHGRITLPYWHTVLGAVLGLALILFTPAYQRALAALARRDRNRKQDADGSR